MDSYEYSEAYRWLADLDVEAREAVVAQAREVAAKAVDEQQAARAGARGPRSRGTYIDRARREIERRHDRASRMTTRGMLVAARDMVLALAAERMPL